MSSKDNPTCESPLSVSSFPQLMACTVQPRVTSLDVWGCCPFSTREPQQYTSSNEPDHPPAHVGHLVSKCSSQPLKTVFDVHFKTSLPTQLKSPDIDYFTVHRRQPCKLINGVLPSKQNLRVLNLRSYTRTNIT